MPSGFFFIIDFHEKKVLARNPKWPKEKEQTNLSVRYVTENVSLLNGPQKRKA